ncbi:hypothetical protein ACYJ1Y_17645 [Natrialbaceae archaeon A-gly3]
MARAKDILIGVDSPATTLYPFLHLSGVIHHQITGMGIHTTLMLFIFTIPLLHLLFIPLLVRLLSIHPISVPLSIISACFLLPLNPARVPTLQPTPMTAAVFFFPVCLYVLFRLISSNTLSNRIVAIICIVALLFFHPQQQFVLLITIGTIIVYGRGLSSFIPQRIDDLRITTITMVLSGVIFIFWMSSHYSFFEQVFRMILILASPAPGQDLSGTATATRLSGESMISVFFKVFTISIIFIAITIISFLYVIFSDTGLDKKILKRDLVVVNRIAILPVSAAIIGMMVLLFIVAGKSDQYSRYLASAMIFASALVPLFSARFFDNNNILSTFRPKAVLSVIVIIFLIMSFLVVHPSMYFSKPTGHVPESHIEGYEQSLLTSNNDVQFIELFSPVHRYRDVTYGRIANQAGIGIPPSSEVIDDSNERPRVPPHFANHELGSEYDQPRYLPISSADRMRTTQVYNGQRFSEPDYKYLDNDNSIAKIRSNNDFELYYIR